MVYKDSILRACGSDCRLLESVGLLAPRLDCGAFPTCAHCMEILLHCKVRQPLKQETMEGLPLREFVCVFLGLFFACLASWLQGLRFPQFSYRNIQLLALKLHPSSDPKSLNP